MPVDISHEVAAQRRANCRPQECRDCEEATGQPALLGRKLAIEHGDGEWEETGSPYSLHHAEEDEDRQAPGQSTQS